MDEFKAICQSLFTAGFFKEYLFPILSAFFSAIMGGFVAYFVTTRHERIKYEKQKVDIANKWILLVQESHANLVSIKQNYCQSITADPLQRFCNTPKILITCKPVHGSFHELAFMVRKREEQQGDWSQVPKISAMINNYNLILTSWEKRNELFSVLQQQLPAMHSSSANLTIHSIQAAIGADNFCTLIDLTERCIVFTDQILLAMEDFLKEFSGEVKQSVNVKKIKKIVNLLEYSNGENQNLERILAPCPQVDYQRLSIIFNESIESLQQRYTTGYENYLTGS